MSFFVCGCIFLLLFCFFFCVVVICNECDDIRLMMRMMDDGENDYDYSVLVELYKSYLRIRYV